MSRDGALIATASNEPGDSRILPPGLTGPMGTIVLADGKVHHAQYDKVWDLLEFAHMLENRDHPGDPNRAVIEDLVQTYGFTHQAIERWLDQGLIKFEGGDDDIVKVIFDESLRGRKIRGGLVNPLGEFAIPEEIEFFLSEEFMYPEVDPGMPISVEAYVEHAGDLNDIPEGISIEEYVEYDGDLDEIPEGVRDVVIETERLQNGLLEGEHGESMIHLGPEEEMYPQYPRLMVYHSKIIYPEGEDIRYASLNYDPMGRLTTVTMYNDMPTFCEPVEGDDCPEADIVKEIEIQYGGMTGGCEEDEHGRVLCWDSFTLPHGGPYSATIRYPQSDEITKRRVFFEQWDHWMEEPIYYDEGYPLVITETQIHDPKSDYTRTPNDPSEARELPPIDGYSDDMRIPPEPWGPRPWPIPPPMPNEPRITMVEEYGIGADGEEVLLVVNEFNNHPVWYMINEAGETIMDQEDFDFLEEIPVENREESRDQMIHEYPYDQYPYSPQIITRRNAEGELLSTVYFEYLLRHYDDMELWFEGEPMPTGCLASDSGNAELRLSCIPPPQMPIQSAWVVLANGRRTSLEYTSFEDLFYQVKKFEEYQAIPPPVPQDPTYPTPREQQALRKLVSGIAEFEGVTVNEDGSREYLFPTSQDADGEKIVFSVVYDMCYGWGSSEHVCTRPMMHKEIEVVFGPELQYFAPPEPIEIRVDETDVVEVPAGTPFKLVFPGDDWFLVDLEEVPEFEWPVYRGMLHKVPDDQPGFLQRSVYELQMSNEATILVDGADRIGREILPDYVGEEVELQGSFFELEGLEILTVTHINGEAVEALIDLV